VVETLLKITSIYPKINYWKENDNINNCRLMHIKIQGATM